MCRGLEGCSWSTVMTAVAQYGKRLIDDRGGWPKSQRSG